ncbi:MAG: dihydropteroate synthase [Planctomycetaceae bacterium]|jgi:cobalamin-dependent methionine synthase I|nr:dihydropteroate synthase [Planctomycetaceae bacterium]
MPVFDNKVLLIGESINDSVPSTKALLDADDIAGIQNLAKSQDEGGADYIDVNIGLRPKEWMTKLVKAIQEVTSKPLSIDSPDVEICSAGLEAYDLERAGGKKPILNSISPLRPEMFELLKIAPCLPILLISEQKGTDGGSQCHTAEETYFAAKSMLATAKEYGLTPSDAILDPGIAPIGSDTKGNLKRLLGAMRLIQNDAELKGVHYSVGLSNFTVMLPTKRKDGVPIKSSLESAFLGKATALGLDMVIGSVKRNYAPLPDDHPAVQCLDQCLAANDFDSLMVVMQFYRG